MRMKKSNDPMDSKGKSPLLFHAIRMYLKIMCTCYKVFGLRRWHFYFYLFKIPIKLIFVHSLLFLDNLFFPNYKEVKIEKPVFIIGHPRSATSFFHALLASSGDFLAFANWEISNPSLIAKKLFNHFKILQIFSSFISDFRYTPHRIKREIKQYLGPLNGIIDNRKQSITLIGQMEEELLFLNILDTQFLAVDTPLGFAEKGFSDLCFADDQPYQERSVSFFKDCLKRQSYHTGKNQLVAKINFSLFRIKTLLKFFPDAKIIFLVRSPLETINSHLSAQQEALDMQYGLKNIPKAQLKQFLKNRYKYNIEFYKRFVELMDGNEISKSQFIVITYASIKNDLKGSVEQVKRFTGIEFSSELDNKIKEQDKKQFSYKRKHKNLSLEAFNLTEEKIKSDFNFFFEKYG